MNHFSNKEGTEHWLRDYFAEPIYATLCGIPSDIPGATYFYNNPTVDCEICILLALDPEIDALLNKARKN